MANGAGADADSPERIDPALLHPHLSSQAVAWLSREGFQHQTEASLILLGGRLILEIPRAVDEEPERHDLKASVRRLERLPATVRYGPVRDQMTPGVAWRELRREGATWPLILPVLFMILIATRTVWANWQMELADGREWTLAIDSRYRRLLAPLKSLGRHLASGARA